MSRLQQLTPTLILVVSTLIDRMYKENKEITMRDFILILSPTIPTVMPILIGIITDISKGMWSLLHQIGQVQGILEFISKHLYPAMIVIMSWFAIKQTKSECITQEYEELPPSIQGHMEKINVATTNSFMQSLVNY